VVELHGPSLASRTIAVRGASQVDSGTFLLASLESLILMKRAANREKDRNATALLEAEIARRREASA
jgi:hypothetical protein